MIVVDVSALLDTVDIDSGEGSTLLSSNALWNMSLGKPSSRQRWHQTKVS